MLAPVDLRAYVSDLHSRAGAALGVGSARYQDKAGVLRGVGCVRTGRTQSISRIVRDEKMTARDGNPVVTLTNSSMALGGVEVLFDRLDMWAHGMRLTHLDAPNHIVVDDVTPATGDLDQSDVAWLRWADQGLVSRGVFFDVPAHRGTDWVRSDEPVTSAELAEVEAKLDFVMEPGDALLLYSGRDRFESAWTGDGLPAVEAAIHQDATEWVADHKLSVLCWDLLDSPPTENFGAHLLIWAEGLAIVDNCDFGKAVEIFRAEQRSSALLTIAPLPITMATSCLINPILTF